MPLRLRALRPRIDPAFKSPFGRRMDMASARPH